VPRDEPRLRESMDYLARLDGLPTELEATRAYVLARLAGPKEAPRVRAMVGKITPGDPYQVALAVLAAEAAGVAQEPAFKAQVQALSEEADRDFIAQSAYEPSAEQFWPTPPPSAATSTSPMPVDASSPCSPTASRSPPSIARR
jgi:hypothetical protein